MPSSGEDMALACSSTVSERDEKSDRESKYQFQGDTEAKMRKQIEMKKKLRTLTLITGNLSTGNPEEEEADRSPRLSLYAQILNSDMLNEDSLANAPGWRKYIYRWMPLSISQAIEAYAIRRNYDAIVSWGERPALLMAFLLKLLGVRYPHVSLTSWISKPKKALILKRVHSHITKMILWSTVQRDIAVNRLGISAEKIKTVSWPVDQKYFRPMPRETDMICSAGREMRDYVTLVEAMKGLDIKCHIAVSLRGKLHDSIKRLYDLKNIPANVTVGNLTVTELRDLYARSRFVVVPLLPTDTDNGITVILEAMAMSKAVICSRTKGQTDVIVEGKTGIFVPQGDVRALKEAITYLWEHPAVAEEMGREGRKRVEEKFTLDQFVLDVKAATEEAILSERTRRGDFHPVSEDSNSALAERPGI